MELIKYIERKKELYDVLFDFLQDGNDEERNYTKLIQEVKKQKFIENHEEFLLLLHLVLKIMNNYHKSNKTINKIEKFLLAISDDIKQTFSNRELFDIFCENKLLLLILLKNKLITFDKSIFLKLKTEKLKN